MISPSDHSVPLVGSGAAVLDGCLDAAVGT